MMKKLFIALLVVCGQSIAFAATDTPDTLVVAKDGSGKFTTLWDAIEDCRAFMDYHKRECIRRK